MINDNAASLPPARPPAPRWASAIYKGIGYLTEELGGGPRVVKLATAINFHKLVTFFIILGMMEYTGNHSAGAWVYLALHGIYGWCWLIKDASGRDSSLDRPVTFGGMAFLYLCYAAWIWGLPWLFLSQHTMPSGATLALAIGLHTIGVVVMTAADLQKTYTLRLKKGLISNGLFAYTRNPNFLGEIMIYASYAILVGNLYGWIFVLVQWLVLFLPRMLMKDASISRHPGWAEYQARSGLIIPWRILTGQAFFDKPRG